MGLLDLFSPPKRDDLVFVNLSSDNTNGKAKCALQDCITNQFQLEFGLTEIWTCKCSIKLFRHDM